MSKGQKLLNDINLIIKIGDRLCMPIKEIELTIKQIEDLKTVDTWVKISGEKFKKEHIGCIYGVKLMEAKNE